MIHIKPANKGKLHRSLGISEKKKIPVSDLEKAKHSSNPATRKRATFALNARSWHHGGGSPGGNAYRARLKG